MDGSIAFVIIVGIVLIQRVVMRIHMEKTYMCAVMMTIGTKMTIL